MSELVASAARFSDRAADYARYRPTYPAAAIDAVLEGLGVPANVLAVDVGAGTGISARLLADRGVRVIALEPNPQMRAAVGDARIDVRDALATATGLADESVDLVTSFQAFHWFANEDATREFARIVRPGGRVALVWNERDKSDALTEAYGRVAEPPRRSDASPAMRGEYRAYVAPLLAAAGFCEVRERLFRNVQPLDLDGLIGRARSASYVPLAGPEADAIVAGLRALHARFADTSGRIALVHTTHVFTAERPLA
jgi:SAM-dependent methyltransferase